MVCLPRTDDQVHRPQATPLLLRGLRRSIALLAAGELVNKAARFLAAIVLARSLSLGDYGLLNVGLAAGGVAVVLVRLGLPDLGTREVAHDPQSATALAGRIIAPQLTGIVTVGVAVAVITSAFAPDAATFGVAAAISMVGLAASADWLLRGQERMRELSFVSALTGLVTLLACVGAIALSSRPLVALGAFAAAELFGAALSWRMVLLDRRPRLQLAGASTLLKRSWPMAVSGVVIYAYYANIDTLIIAGVRSAEEAGLYSGAYRLFLACNAVVIFAGQALLPVATRLAREGVDEESGALLRGALQPLLGYGLACAAGAELLGRPGLELVLGDEFGAAAPTLVLLCLSVPWYAMGFPLGYALIAVHRQREYMRGALVGFFLNMALCASLIPVLGIEGAGLATLIAFAAAALVWLGTQGMLRSTGPLLAGVGALTAVTLVCVAADLTTIPVGIVTALAAAAAIHAGRTPKESLA